VDNLFETEEGFIGKEKKSVKSVKEQWDIKIRKFKEKFGWLNGTVSSHLPPSDKALLESGLYKIIHQVVYELWEHDKKKRIRGKKALETEHITLSSLPVIPTSTDIFDHQKKRKISSSSSEVAAATAVAEISSPGAGAGTTSATAAGTEEGTVTNWKNFRVPPESVLEARIIKRVKKESNDFTHATLMELLKIDLATVDIALFSNFSLLINIFCSPGKNFEPEYVKNTYKEIGLGSLDAHKVYYYLNRIKNGLL